MYYSLEVTCTTLYICIYLTQSVRFLLILDSSPSGMISFYLLNSLLRHYSPNSAEDVLICFYDSSELLYFSEELFTQSIKLICD